jgi:hypothetical protein
MSAAPGEPATRAAIPSAAREAMEKLNAEAGGLHIWLRTQANAPAQRRGSRTAASMSAGRLPGGGSVSIR